MNEEFRVVIHFCWLRQLSPQETFKEMEEDQSKQLLNTLKSLSQSQMIKVITCDESWFFLWYFVDGI